jgi:WD40 repeat protein
MISDGKTHTIVTTSCDGSISVYDMLENKKKITRMRIVRECGDITCSAFSRDSNMIATGDAKRQIRLWNYATMNTEKDRLPRLENHVTSLAFVDPYPLLLSSDVSGRIFVWNIRTKKCVGVLNLLHNSTTSSSKFSGASIVDMRVVFEQKGGSEICPGIQTGAHLLVVSDSRGFITVLTLNSIIKALNVRVVSSEITTRSRYRVDRFDDRLFEEDQRENIRHQNVKKLDIKIISKWRAHDDMVKQMCVLSDPKCVVTLSSKSKNIKIWSLGHTSSMCGLILGELDTVRVIT